MKLTSPPLARWACRALFALGLAATLVLPSAGPAAAAEGGSLPFPSGLFTQNAAIVPAPGSTYLLLYTLALDSSKLAGAHGQGVLPDFHVDAVGQATRVLHTWTASVDGIHFSTGVSPVFQVVDTDRGPRHHLAGSMRQVYITPLAMTRQVGPFHLLLSEDLFVGVGQHTPANPASTALGYTSVVPFRDVPQLAFGVGGYYADQLTGDRRSGLPVPGGDRLRQLDVGPNVRWTFGPGL